MSRSRSGCQNCRRRHRKCDEAKPACFNCQAHGIECDGYSFVLKWDVGATFRRHLTPGSTADVPRTYDVGNILPLPSTQTSHAENVGFESGSSTLAEGYRSTSSPEAANAMMVQSPELRLSTSWPLQQDYRLVDEFFRENVYQLYSTRRNDELPNILHDLSRQSQPLMDIITGMHLYMERPLGQGESFEPYQTRGLALFRNRLGTYNGSLDASVLWTGLLVCTMSLYQGIPWSSLLDHMMNVYELRRHLLNHAPELHQPAVRFVVEAMGIMDMPTFVRGRETVTQDLWAEIRLAQATQGDKMLPGGVETLSGLPRSLLDIFAAIKDPSAESRFLSWPGEVGDVPATHLWEAYRCAGILTAQRQHRLSTPGARADIIVSRLIAALDALCETRRCPEYNETLATNAVLYPIVAARLEVSLLKQHPLWLATLRRIQQALRPYGATANARQVSDMLDEAFELNDNSYDLDAQARKREIEIALF